MTERKTIKVCKHCNNKTDKLSRLGKQYYCADCKLEEVKRICRSMDDLTEKRANDKGK